MPQQDMAGSEDRYKYQIEVGVEIEVEVVVENQDCRA